MRNLFTHLKEDWYKYLLEILVITFGILGAFALNNWNDSRKRSEDERKILAELLTNLRQDSIDNAINSKWYETVANSAEIVNQTLEMRLPWHDSLAGHFGALYRHGISTFNVSAYENLKTKGFDLVSNDSIRIALTRLHTISYRLIEKNEEEFSMDNYNSVLLPVLTSRLKMESWWSATPLDYKALFDDSVFQETIRYRAITMRYVGDNTSGANRRVTELIQMIEKELQQ